MEIECPNCKKILELPDNAVGVKVRCSFCRATFIGEEPAVPLSAPAGSGSKFCPNCGAQTVAGFKFCANCGQSLGATKLVKVASRTPSATVDCVVCGKHMRESSAVKCPRCGNNVCKTHYNRKLDVCSRCTSAVEGELANTAVEVGLSGDWNRAFELVKHADKKNGLVLYVFAAAYANYGAVPSLAYHSREHNIAKHWEYLKASAIAGYPRAQFEFGQHREYYDVEEALGFYTLAADNEFVPAQLKLGKMYADGFKKNELIVKDDQKAFVWFKRAAENGDAEACYRVSKCYGLPIGTAYDPELSIVWLKRSAEKNYPPALHTLGNFSRMGTMMVKDNIAALEYYERAANCGYDRARMYLLSGVTHAKFMAINLSEGPNAVNYPITDFTNLEDVLTWNDEYKTSYLVLRRIETGSFVSGNKTVHISIPYYIGVFPVTQRQWELVMGDRPSHFCNEQFYAARPVEHIQYKDIRGDSNHYCIPESVKVLENSFIGNLRRKTRMLFDLPTCAQWEYACRAGTTTKYNNGSDSCVGIGRFGPVIRPEIISKDCDLSNGTITVGLFPANRWGIYDMHGNVSEFCLDYLDKYNDGSDNPLGSNSNQKVAIRGGSWLDDGNDWPSHCWKETGTCFATWEKYRTEACSGKGFRVVLNFREWDSPKC